MPIPRFFSSEGVPLVAVRIPFESRGADEARTIPGSLLPVLRGLSLYVLFLTNAGFVFSFLSSDKEGTDLLIAFSASLAGPVVCGLLWIVRTSFGVDIGAAGELTVPLKAPCDTFFGGDSLRATLGFDLGVKDGVGIRVGKGVGTGVEDCFDAARGVVAMEGVERPAGGGLRLLLAAIRSRLWLLTSSSLLDSSSPYKKQCE